MADEFWRLVEQSVRFQYLAGEVTRVPPHTEEPWRTLPCNVLAQNQGDDMCVELRDGPALEVPSGWGFFISANRTHYIRSDSPHWRVSRWAHLAYTVFDAVDLFEVLPVGVRIPAERADQLGDLCADLAALHQGPSGLARCARIHQLGHAILAHIAELTGLASPTLPSVRRFRRLAPVLGLMTQQCGEPFTTASLCERTGLSPSRLHALFQEVTGLPPMKYLQRIRLSRAQYLLTATDKKVGEIGADVGYPDPYHFSRLFRKQTGMSPTAYRKRVSVERTSV